MQKEKESFLKEETILVASQKVEKVCSEGISGHSGAWGLAIPLNFIRSCVNMVCTRSTSCFGKNHSWMVSLPSNFSFPLVMCYYE